MFREARQLWQLTPVGREEHKTALVADVGHLHIAEKLHASYEVFLGINERFKALCGDWQLKDGAPNDHGDSRVRPAQVDRAARGAERRGRSRWWPQMAVQLERLHAYGPRLASTCQRVVAGETNMFTGVMCGSYHDVWMELHEDLILTQGIDRSAEGSF